MSPNPHPTSRIKELKLDRYIGNQAVLPRDVRAARTPRPKGGWKPVNHWKFYKLIESALKRSDLGVAEVFHALYGGGSRYIGLAITEQQVDGRDVVVGWFNAHDKSHSATLLLGEQVLVCFNLCLFGEVQVMRRHTRYIKRDLPQLVAHGVGSFGNRLAEQRRRQRRYDEHPLSREDGPRVLVDLLDAGAFPPSYFTRVLREWREPSVPAFAREWNVNRLFQAVTFQRTPLLAMASRHRGLHRVLDGYCKR